MVDRAIDAIRSAGPDVSMDELASRMSVSKPVVYDEFGGRVGVADAIAVESWQRIERGMIKAFTTAPSVDIETVVHGCIDALITFIETEPELYGFFVRAIRTDGRGFLDNGLLRVLRDRFGFLIGSFGNRIDPDELVMVTDGAYGFIFAAIESWQASGRLSRDVLVNRLSQILLVGIEAVDFLPAAAISAQGVSGGS